MLVCMDNVYVLVCMYTCLCAYTLCVHDVGVRVGVRVCVQVVITHMHSVC